MAVEMADLPPLTPYIMRGFYEWCTDNGFTPQILVVAEEQDTNVDVPRDYVQDGKIAFNIAPTACGNLCIDNECVTFNATFGGQKRRVWIPIGNVVAIYARENGACLPFELKRVEPKKEVPESQTGKPLFTKV